MSTRITYSGATPTGTARIVAFSTVAAGWGKNHFPMYGIERFVLDVKHDQTFTLEWFKSDDRGTTWHQMGTNSVTVTPSSTSTRDIFVPGVPDFKVEVVNGGLDQTVWEVDMTLTTDRSPAA